jgi:hypothetical protein
MHSRYARDKVQFVSISLDDPRDPAARDEAAEFLRSMQPGFPAYYFADRPKALQEDFPFEYLPCIFVIDKAGEKHKFEGAFSMGEVERAVREGLKK